MGTQAASWCPGLGSFHLVALLCLWVFDAFVLMTQDGHWAPSPRSGRQDGGRDEEAAYPFPGRA